MEMETVCGIMPTIVKGSKVNSGVNLKLCRTVLPGVIKLMPVHMPGKPGNRRLEIRRVGFTCPTYRSMKGDVKRNTSPSGDNPNNNNVVGIASPAPIMRTDVPAVEELQCINDVVRN